jgi:hypothetical protein
MISAEAVYVLHTKPRRQQLRMLLVNFAKTLR